MHYSGLGQESIEIQVIFTLSSYQPIIGSFEKIVSTLELALNLHSQIVQGDLDPIHQPSHIVGLV
jgi:hypothetical protein